LTGFAITGIWAAKQGDVIVIVNDGSAFRLVGGAWQAIPPPANGGLLAIWGTTKPDEVFASGAGGTILRFDGATWTPMTSNTNRGLNAIWGTSPTSLVAAGAAGTIQQYSGSNWQAAPSTPLTGLTLRGVWTGGTRVVAAGWNQSVPTMGITATREGAAWNTQAASAMYLFGVWGRADDDIYAVGSAGTIVHFDGTTWMPMTSTTQVALQAVGGTAANVFAVGDEGTILRYSPAD
jgi:hypothetical protein